MTRITPPSPRLKPKRVYVYYFDALNLTINKISRECPVYFGNSIVGIWKIKK